MNNRNRIPELIQRIEFTKNQSLPEQDEFEKLCELVAKNPLKVKPLDEIIEYKGYIVYEDGTISRSTNTFGFDALINTNNPTERKSDLEVLQEIEKAVKRGEINLTDKQNAALQKVRQRIEQNNEIGEADFRQVAEGAVAIEYKSGIASQIKAFITPERENGDTIPGQGE